MDGVDDVVAVGVYVVPVRPDGTGEGDAVAMSNGVKVVLCRLRCLQGTYVWRMYGAER